MLKNVSYHNFKVEVGLYFVGVLSQHVHMHVCTYLHESAHIDGNNSLPVICTPKCI